MNTVNMLIIYQIGISDKNIHVQFLRSEYVRDSQRRHARLGKEEDNTFCKLATTHDS